jgi:phage terminase small subunit
MRAQWEREFLAWAKEFGMTPSSRARLTLPVEPNPGDPMDEWLREKE